MSSPGFQSTYSYPSDITLSPQPITRSSHSREPSAERRAPRLSSPTHFREFFTTNGGSNSPVRHHGSNLPLPPVGVRGMDGVNRALQSATRAVQTAQEAFQSRHNPSINTFSGHGDVVDLTNSPPNAVTTATASLHPTATASTSTNVPTPSYDAFLSRFLHPHDSSTRQPGNNHFFNDPIYGIHASMHPRRIPYGNSSSHLLEPDSVGGSRRRQDLSRHSNLGIPNMERSLLRSGASDVRRRDEEEAIRRQRLARQQWESNQRRTTERQRLEAQRQRILSPELHRQTQMATHTANNLQSSPVDRDRRHPSSSPTSSSIEAVDLTEVDDETTLQAALSKQRLDAVASQQTSSAQDNTGHPSTARTPLTAYKCPICMEAPQFATTTTCGHLFCHKCILDTLKWSENQRRDEIAPGRKVKGVCPVCRKELSRKEEPGVGRGLVPMEIKALTKAQINELKRKRDVDGKGKGRARDSLSHDGDVRENKDANDNTNRPKKKAKTIKKDDTDDDSLFEFNIFEETY